MLKSLASKTRPLRVVMVLLGLASLLFVPVPLVLNSAFSKALLDLIHLPLFVALTLCSFTLARSILQWGERRVFATTFVLMIAFAGGSEGLQALVGRDASWGDFMNNLSAIAIALTGLRWWRARRKGECWKVWRMAFIGCTLLGISLALISPIRAAMAVRRQVLRLPQFGDFEEDWELLLWHEQGEAEGRMTTMRRSSDHAARGSYSLELHMAAVPWAGIHLLSGGEDWSSFSALGFSVFNPGEAFELGIRLDTNDGERFSAMLSIAPGTNACVLPLNRLKSSSSATSGGSLHGVARLVLHGGPASVSRTLFLDDVRLE